jgi:hypothetical protein
MSATRETRLARLDSISLGSGVVLLLAALAMRLAGAIALGTHLLRAGVILVLASIALGLVRSRSRKD